MENIRQAIERARADKATLPQRQPVRREALSTLLRSSGIDPRRHKARLNPNHLLSKRIIAHDPIDPRSRSFDMLRTQVLRAMELNGWQTVAITSPTPACGKTVTALNLALSIARQPERAVFVADFDLRKPQVASYLGVRYEGNLIDVLDNRLSLDDAVFDAHVGDYDLTVLPTNAVTAHSSELMASNKMVTLLEQIKHDYRSRVVIIDLPPVLSGDDVIAILPRIDCILLVVAAGMSTPAQIKEAAKHLQSADIVRVVLTKTTESEIQDYYGYAMPKKN